MSSDSTVYHLDDRWHTGAMPTSHPRYQVTETPAVARAIDRAAQRWPGEPRGKLLLRLVDVGGQALEQEHLSGAAAHRAAVTASSGAYTEAFEIDYLSRLREDWPA